ncbi:hypothetical protein GY45DRAFT_1366832 [Cubamyces sp. BRFM 1775]|nr:hypothetical protein GY45DRAFT_1366832 [Cubamyces sp. BRFM 1775]
MPPVGRGPTLRELVEEPFGPYLEADVLTAACKNTTSKNVLALRRLLLECGGKVTGHVFLHVLTSLIQSLHRVNRLDECEPTQPEYDADRFSDTPVRFRGILEIQSLSWLTEDAYATIEQELRARDVNARKARGGQGSASVISLKSMYDSTNGGQVKIKVEIQGVKHLPAVYLSSVFAPDGLLIVSGRTESYRRFTVESLHIHTFKRSRLYLARYRLYNVMTNLLCLDAGLNHHQSNKTPLSKRTPDWFIDLYMTHMAQHGATRRHRPVHDSDSDSDIEPHSGGRMRDAREHTLRHVSRAEVYSLFATHAEWVVQEVAALRMHKWLDVDLWKRWLVDIRRIRRLAAREGVQWGVSDGVEVSLGSIDEEIPPVAPPKPKKGKKTHQTRVQTRNSSRASTSSSTRRSTNSPALNAPAPAPAYRAPSPMFDDTMLRTYDSDFSTASTPPGSPSSSSSGLPDSRPASPVDPDIVALIPSEFYVPPQVSATFQWACPVQECGYLIDLLHLTEENLATEDVTEDEKRRLKGRRWNIREDWVREAFGYMVDKHLLKHLDEWGIRLEMQGRRFKAVWKHPQVTHLQSGRIRNVKKDNRRPVIKEEDS